MNKEKAKKIVGKFTLDLGIRRYFIWLLPTCISMIGYTMHNSFWWAVLDFIFSPVVLCKWLIYHQITWSIIKQTFEFFFN